MQLVTTRSRFLRRLFALQVKNLENSFCAGRVNHVAHTWRPQSAHIKRLCAVTLYFGSYRLEFMDPVPLHQCSCLMSACILMSGVEHMAKSFLWWSVRETGKMQ